jgi:hypothetical protein
MSVPPLTTEIPPVELVAIETALPAHVVTRQETQSHLSMLAGGRERARKFEDGPALYRTEPEVHASGTDGRRVAPARLAQVLRLWS